MPLFHWGQSVGSPGGQALLRRSRHHQRAARRREYRGQRALCSVFPEVITETHPLQDTARARGGMLNKKGSHIGGLEHQKFQCVKYWRLLVEIRSLVYCFFRGCFYVFIRWERNERKRKERDATKGPRPDVNRGSCGSHGWRLNR